MSERAMLRAVVPSIAAEAIAGDDVVELIAARAMRGDLIHPSDLLAVLAYARESEHERGKAADALERLERESAGRLAALNAKAEELRAEWQRAENAEAKAERLERERDEARESVAFINAEAAVAQRVAEARATKAEAAAEYERHLHACAERSVEKFMARATELERALRNIGCAHGGPANAGPCDCSVCRALLNRSTTTEATDD